MTNQKILALITASIIIIIIIMFVQNTTQNITCNEKINNNTMAIIENKFSKKYPIDDDYFRIVHCPKYSSFFDQFINYQYFITKDSNATCCIAKLKNGFGYICDLKSHKKKQNNTFKFIFTYYLKKWKNFQISNNNLFGIVMEPNNVVNKLSNKHLYTSKKHATINLYQIPHETYISVKHVLNKIFGHHFFVEGYKKLILESNNKSLKIGHLATLNNKHNDLHVVNIIQKPILNLDNYELMFCIPEKSKYNNDLSVLGIKVKSQMSVYGIFVNNNVNWNFIRTYMI